MTKQKEDLTGSINDLLEIINELDDTMKERLLSTFNALNNEFCKVFKKLFRGGEGKLVLLDENNKVQLIGKPIPDSKLWELYKKIITQ